MLILLSATLACAPQSDTPSESEPVALRTLRTEHTEGSWFEVTTFAHELEGDLHAGSSETVDDEGEIVRTMLASVVDGLAEHQAEYSGSGSLMEASRSEWDRTSLRRTVFEELDGDPTAEDSPFVNRRSEYTWSSQGEPEETWTLGFDPDTGVVDYEDRERCLVQAGNGSEECVWSVDLWRAAYTDDGSVIWTEELILDDDGLPLETLSYDPEDDVTETYLTYDADVDDEGRLTRVSACEDDCSIATVLGFDYDDEGVIARISLTLVRDDGTELGGWEGAYHWIAHPLGGPAGPLSTMVVTDEGGEVLDPTQDIVWTQHLLHIVQQDPDGEVDFETRHDLEAIALGEVP